MDVHQLSSQARFVLLGLGRAGCRAVVVQRVVHRLVLRADPTDDRVSARLALARVILIEGYLVGSLARDRVDLLASEAVHVLRLREAHEEVKSCCPHPRLVANHVTLHRPLRACRLEEHCRQLLMARADELLELGAQLLIGREAAVGDAAERSRGTLATSWGFWVRLALRGCLVRRRCRRGRRRGNSRGRLLAITGVAVGILSLVVLLLVVVVERVLPQHLLRDGVDVVDVSVWRLCLVPPLRVLSLQCLVGDPQQHNVLLEVHPEVHRILEHVARLRAELNLALLNLV
mmetsp:Transcript_38533/g.77173  ORF Transcript_38533/g.77173 Transcript_38533/m.77173 type:complete len:289 (-) Transcript_38533:2895-3761(-)